MTLLLILTLLAQTPRDTTAAAAPQARGTASIGGVVAAIDANGARVPLRRAVVSLMGTELRVPERIGTDDAGRFMFSNLPAGRYTLIAEKAGYLKTYAGSRRPGFPPALPVAVVDGQHVDDLPITVTRGSVIEGRVTDALGLPIAAAQVMVFESKFVWGERKLVTPGGGAIRFVTTDDRGNYRMYGLPPGEYAVRAGADAMTSTAQRLSEADVRAAENDIRGRSGFGASPEPPQANPVTLDNTYYPSTVDAATAQIVTLGLADVRSGIDIVLAGVQKHSVTLNVTSPFGHAPADAMIAIAKVSTGTLYSSPGMVRPNETGRARAGLMPPGRYLFFGRGSEKLPDGSIVPLFLSTEVNVDNADVDGAMLLFSPGQRVSGNIKAVSGAFVVSPATRVVLDPVGAIGSTFAAPVSRPVGADGSFTFDAVAPGRYRASLAGLPGLYLTQAAYQNIDTLDDALDVRAGADVEGLALSVTNQLTSISGLVRDSAGRPSPDYVVLIFPKNRVYWPIAPRRFSGAKRISSDGQFRVEGLPPGDYLLAVVFDADADQVTDPTFLEQLVPGAVSITLAPGQRVTQDLRVGGG